MSAIDRAYFRVRVPQDLADLVTDRAYLNRRSVSAEVTVLLQQALGLNPGVDAKPPKFKDVGSRASGRKLRAGRSGAAIEDILEGEPLELDPPRSTKSAKEVFSKITPEKLAELEEISDRLNDIFGKTPAKKK